MNQVATRTGATYQYYPISNQVIYIEAKRNHPHVYNNVPEMPSDSNVSATDLKSYRYAKGLR